MSGNPLTALEIIAVSYRNSRLAVADERPIARFAASGVYESAGVPVSISMPEMIEALRSDSETDNLGLLNGAIADDVAAARAEGKVVLLTGGDCTHMTGMLGGLQDAHGPEANIGLVWFDAHGDFNTPGTTLSGMLGGMPVAVCAGLAYPRWRELSHIVAPLPTNRIVMVDVRNLDAPEERLIRATDVTIARVAPGQHGDVELETAVATLADSVDYIYLHIDSDILDIRYVPNHGTGEPHGPDMDQVLAGVNTIMATGKVAALALVSVYGAGEGSDVSVNSGIQLLHGSLLAWQKYGGV